MHSDRPFEPVVDAFHYHPGGRLPLYLVRCAPCDGAIHSHGAAALGGRGSHCTCGASPYFGGSYQLGFRGVVGRPNDLKVAAPLRNMSKVFASASPNLRRAVIRSFFGPRAGLGVRRRLNGFLVLSRDGSWVVKPPSGPREEGRDLIGLIAALFRARPGEAAVMLLEAMTQARFDARTAGVLMTAINTWAAAGAPSRREGL